MRADLPGGEAITLEGFVLDIRCRPLPGVRVEIWHADDAGRYDIAGFRLRAMQRTDARGRWGFETIVPRFYSVRTAHYHFRVQRPAARALVTQLYFPGHPRNAGDSIFDPRLLMAMGRSDGRQTGRFDFVL